MSFKELLNLKFSLLDTKKNRLFLVLFILIYSVLFLNIFAPFNIKSWMVNSHTSEFIQLLTYSLIGASSFAFSQFLLGKWLKTNQFNNF